MMTQARGESVLHETVSESRFAYVDSLRLMGAHIELFNPPVNDPDSFYNFNLSEEKPGHFHAAKIFGPATLKGGEFEIKDLRHGATLMIAGLIAEGETILHDNDEHIDRGYEELDAQLRTMGGTIERIAKA
jgi:UDP-N-acetylglucosamine 1-carboxyvinyltransferase